MEAIVMAVVILGITGLAMGLFLAFAAKKFEVEIDPKIEQIIEALPGANCGGCGYPGCSGYACAIVEEGASMTLCAPGGASVAGAIGDIMGASVDASADKVVARVLCQGDNTKTKKRYDFEGELTTCAAVNLYAGGDKSCKYGCLGYGDCTVVCPVDAIKITDKGIASVDEDACIGCGLCAKACPKSVIAMTAAKKKVTVKCSSKDKGGDARKACGIACIGCGMCAKACPFGAIEVSNNLAKIDPAKCKNCQLCVVVCPTQAIFTAVGRPLPKKPVPKKPAAKKPAAKPAVDKAAAVAKDAVKTVEKAADKAVDGAKAAVKATEKVAEKATATAKAAEAKVETAAKKTVETAKKAETKAVETAEATVKAVEKAVETTKKAEEKVVAAAKETAKVVEKAAETTKKAEEKVVAAAKETAKVVEKAAETTEKAVEATKEAKDKVKETTKAAVLEAGDLAKKASEKLAEKL